MQTGMVKVMVINIVIKTGTVIMIVMKVMILLVMMVVMRKIMVRIIMNDENCDDKGS